MNYVPLATFEAIGIIDDRRYLLFAGGFRLLLWCRLQRFQESFVDISADILLKLEVLVSLFMIVLWYVVRVDEGIGGSVSRHERLL